MMYSRSAVNLCLEHPECIHAMESLLQNEEGEWIPVRDVREQNGIELNIWRSLIQKLGEAHGIGLLESTRDKSKSWPSQVRIKTGFQDTVRRLIEVVQNESS